MWRDGRAMLFLVLFHCELAIMHMDALLAVLNIGFSSIFGKVGLWWESGAFCKYAASWCGALFVGHAVSAGGESGLCFITAKAENLPHAMFNGRAMHSRNELHLCDSAVNPNVCSIDFRCNWYQLDIRTGRTECDGRRILFLYALYQCDSAIISLVCDIDDWSELRMGYWPVN